MIEFVATSGAFFLLTFGLACTVLVPFVRASAESEGFQALRSQLYGNVKMDCPVAKHWMQVEFLELTHHCPIRGNIRSEFKVPGLPAMKLNTISMSLPKTKVRQ